MKRRTSQGQAMRSIFGRSRVTQREEEFLGFLKSSPPISRQASMLPSRYLARSVLAALWLTSRPCTQYTTTLAARGSVFSQVEIRSGSRRKAPLIMESDSRNGCLRRTSMTNGGVSELIACRRAAGVTLASLALSFRVLQSLDAQRL